MVVECLVRWSRPVAHLQTALSRNRTTVIFDGDCGICQKTIDLVQRWVDETEYAFVGYQDVDPAALDQVGLSAEKCQTHMRVVTPTRRVYTGAFAFNYLAFQHPVGRIVVAAIYLVPIALVAQVAGYEWVARNRHRISERLGLTACRMSVALRPDVRDY